MPRSADSIQAVDWNKEINHTSGRSFERTAGQSRRVVILSHKVTDFVTAVVVGDHVTVMYRITENTGTGDAFSISRYCDLSGEFLAEEIAGIPGGSPRILGNGIADAYVRPREAFRRWPVDRPGQIIAGLVVVSLQKSTPEFLPFDIIVRRCESGYEKRRRDALLDE